MADPSDDDEATKSAPFEEEDSGDAASQSGDPVISDSLNNVVEHPLLSVAIQPVKQNSESCFSRIFVIVDKKDQTEHKAALLRLPGIFQS